MGLVWFHQIPRRPEKIRRSGTGAYLPQRTNIRPHYKKNSDKTQYSSHHRPHIRDPNNHDKLAEEKAAAELNIKVLRFPMSGTAQGI